MITGAMNEPTTIQAGDKLTWQESHPDYPASAGWSLRYVLRNHLNKYEFSAITNGDSFKVTLLSATTSTFVAGTYKLYPEYINGDDNKREPEITVIVTPNPFSESTFDDRSYNQKMLEKYQTALLNKQIEINNLSVASPLGSRQAAYEALEKLEAFVEKYKNLVENEKRQELIAAGKPAGGRSKLKFLN